MAVEFVCGMTQSGKSRYVEFRALKKYNRVVVFDPMKCFATLETRLPLHEGAENSALEKAYKHAMARVGNFRIGLCPERQIKYHHILDKVCRTVRMVGERIGSDNDKILLVVDEAGDVCSPTFISSTLKGIVTRGRHDFVDSLFIAQRPQMIHGDIKANASRVVCFNLATATEISWINQIFGRRYAEKIQTLPLYHYATWENTGRVTLTNASGKVYEERGASGAA